MESDIDKIKRLLEPLFIQANREKKWFLSTYQAMLFSPKELRSRHNRGELLWGPKNWQLVDPPKLKDPKVEFENAVRYNNDLLNRIEDGWES